MRLILAVLLALPLASAAWAAGPKDGPDDAVLRQAANSLVQVIASGCSGEEPARAGSGFAIGKGGPFVTDLHVVAGCTDYLIRRQNDYAWTATLVRVLKARDLALLKVDPPPTEIPGLQISAATPSHDERLDVIGYPLGLSAYDSAELSVGIATETTPQLQYALDDQASAELQSTGYPAPDTDVVRVNGSLEPGDSGAPVIDWQGNVAAVGDGGLERGTVGIAWATQPQYVKELEDSNDSLSVASLGSASVQFAVAIPQTVVQTAAQTAANTLNCGALSLERRRDVKAGKLIKTTDDPVKLRDLLLNLIGAQVAQFDNDEFTIWTEPKKSGAGIALPKGLSIEAGTDHCTVRTAVPNIDYVIALTPLSPDAASSEWQIEANRQEWLAVHRMLAAANTNQLLLDRKFSVPRRFRNGGIVIRQMLTGQSKDGRPVRVFTNDLSGRGAFVSVSVVNRDAKADPSQMTAAEQSAWAQGLLAVNLTALPPVAEDAAAAAQSSGGTAPENSEMVWPGPRNYPWTRCGDWGLIPVSQPRRLADLPGSANLDAVLRPVAGVSAAAIANDQFDIWVQPLRGAVVLLPHGLTPTADPQACRIAAPNSPISFSLRVVKLTPEASGPDRRREVKAAAQAFLRDLSQAADGRFRPDRAVRFQAKVEPNGLVQGRLLIGGGGQKGAARALIYLVSLRRDFNLTLFAMTDADVKTLDALAPADRMALAQALAAVRLSTLLPPTGFLTATQTTNPGPAAAQSASH
jgi:S1-C subfamily serine protease